MTDAREVIGLEVSNYCIHTGHPAPTSDAEPLACEDCRTVRDALIRALASARLKVIAREPTDRMMLVDSAYLAAISKSETESQIRIWCAMWDAAPTDGRQTP